MGKDIEHILRLWSALSPGQTNNKDIFQQEEKPFSLEQVDELVPESASRSE